MRLSACIAFLALCVAPTSSADLITYSTQTSTYGPYGDLPFFDSSLGRLDEVRFDFRSAVMESYFMPSAGNDVTLTGNVQIYALSPGAPFYMLAPEQRVQVLHFDSPFEGGPLTFTVDWAERFTRAEDLERFTHPGTYTLYANGYFTADVEGPYVSVSRDIQASADIDVTYVYSVPEPSTLTMWTIAAAGLSLVCWRRR